VQGAIDMLLQATDMHAGVLYCQKCRGAARRPNKAIYEAPGFRQARSRAASGYWYPPVTPTAKSFNGEVVFLCVKEMIIMAAYETPCKATE